MQKKLGISGIRTKISLTTLEKMDSLIDSFVEKDKSLDLSTELIRSIGLTIKRLKADVSSVSPSYSL